MRIKAQAIYAKWFENILRDIRHRHVPTGVKMLDLIFLALTIIFFLLSLAYVRGCDRL